MNYLIHLGIYWSLYSIGALGVSLVSRYCGLLTLASAAYFAIGAYVYALAVRQLGLGFVAAFLIVVVVSSMLSLLISLPTVRVKGDHFVLVSIAVQTVVYGILYNWYDASAPLGTIQNLTNGPFGIPRIPKPDILGIRFDTIGSMLALVGTVLVFLLVVHKALVDSPWSRFLIAIRDDELAARSLSKNTRFLKASAVLVSCVFLGISGLLYAAYSSYVDPSVGSLDLGVTCLSMALIGNGLAKGWWGPILGSFVMVALPEIFRFVGFGPEKGSALRLLVFGLSLIWVAHSSRTDEPLEEL